MPMPPGIYSGRGKAQRTGDLPLGQGFDWTRTVAAQKEAAREEQLRAASSRPDSFQTLQQFEWLPQHGRTRPIRQYPPSSFSRTPASFLADRPGFRMETRAPCGDFSMSNFHRKATNISTQDMNYGRTWGAGGLDQWGSTTSLLTGGECTVATAPSRRFHQQQYAHVLTPAGIRRAKAVERRPVSPLRSVNGYQGIWE
ncbi:hypothetical protein JL720_5818 [Aureococcus anophagefferens]|nr:hypothetical protein JL720_5818 [Aureococcus anophagefferens]